MLQENQLEGKTVRPLPQAKLLEGLNGTESELTPADWRAIRKEALAKLEARKKPR